LIGRIAERLLAVDSAAWREVKNARAAIVYVLSGGQPRVLRKILELGVSPEEETRLMEGALAYVEGRTAKAKQILLPLDAKELASMLGGHVALVQSALVGKDDPGKATQLLDQARILDPGTLVEEAALRREIFLVDEGGDLERFAALSSQYIRRFPKSVYADNFRSRFADSVTRFGLKGDAAGFAKVVKLLSELDAVDRLRLYLKIAQAGILNGKIGPARLAAEQAAQLSKDGSVEGTRSKLYEAAALILTSSLEEGLGELRNVDGSRLSKHDAELKEAVAGIAKQIGKSSDESLEAIGPEPKGGATPASAEASAKAAELIQAAQGALGQSDKLLKERAP
jgi:chemotaxis protein MotC